MTPYRRRHWGLAICLSALAGYVDAIGFLNLDGLFISFMSGNSTRLAVGLASKTATTAATAAGLIACFVLGVMVGCAVATLAGTARKPAVLAAVTLLLATAAGLEALAGGRGTLALMAIAMGAENAVFLRDGEVRIGLTYMTGALVKLGQRATAAILGGDRFGWVPYLLLWSSLVSGAVLGAIAYGRVGMTALWGAVAASAALGLAATRLRPSDRDPQEASR